MQIVVSLNLCDHNKATVDIRLFPQCTVCCHCIHWQSLWGHVKDTLQINQVWYSIEQCQHTRFHFTALWILSGTTRVSRYQKKHSPTHTYRSHQSSLICFLHLLQSMASSLFNLRAWHTFSTISLQVFFGLPLGLAPSTSYSMQFFTQS